MSGPPRRSGVSAEQRLRRVEDRRRLMKALRERVAALCAESRLTEAELARRCGLERSTVLDRAEPKLSLILVICDGLKVSPDVLLAGLPVPEERSRL